MSQYFYNIIQYLAVFRIKFIFKMLKIAEVLYNLYASLVHIIIPTVLNNQLKLTVKIMFQQLCTLISLRPVIVQCIVHTVQLKY